MRRMWGARLAVLPLLGTVILGVSSCGSGDSEPRSGGTARATLKVGLAYDIGGRGDKSFNDAAAAGLDRVKQDLDVQAKDVEAQKAETEEDKYARLKLLCEGGYQVVIAVGFTYAGVDAARGPMARAAKECPDTKFAIIDDSSVNAGNVANLVFAAEQGSFLVGATAALKSRTGHLGFVGGCLADVITPFQAGYEAGARAVKPDIKLEAEYLSTPAQQCSGFNAPDAGRAAAEAMYDHGADVVYHAAGKSGIGVFRAAKVKGRLAIGVDSDQRELVPPDLRDVVLTSMLKRVDVALYEFVKAVAENRFKPGITTFDLRKDGVGYATSGGQIADLVPRIEQLKKQIIDGAITVPTRPAD